MTATTNEVEIIRTSTTNFFYAVSSNGHDVYGLLITAPGCATCTCVGFEVYHRNCKHRKALLASYTYIDEDAYNRLYALELEVHEWRAAQGWLDILDAVEAQAELDAVEALWNDAA